MERHIGGYSVRLERQTHRWVLREAGETDTGGCCVRLEKQAHKWDCEMGETDSLCV